MPLKQAFSFALCAIGALWLHTANFQCFQFFSVEKEKGNIFQKKTEKRKPIGQGRREGMSSFFVKILPEVRGWRFLQKPAGLELYSPVRRLIFALLFWFLSAGFLFIFLLYSLLLLLICGTGAVGRNQEKSACG